MSIYDNNISVVNIIKIIFQVFVCFDGRSVIGRVWRSLSLTTSRKSYVITRRHMWPLCREATPPATPTTRWPGWVRWSRCVSSGCDLHRVTWLTHTRHPSLAALTYGVHDAHKYTHMRIHTNNIKFWQWAFSDITKGRDTTPRLVATPPAKCWLRPSYVFMPFQTCRRLTKPQFYQQAVSTRLNTIFCGDPERELYKLKGGA